MKKLALILTIVSTLIFATAAIADSWNLNELKTQAAKAVPGAQMLGADADEYSAFVGMQGGGLNYQFTLAADQNPQMPDARLLNYNGRKAYFFEPGMPGSGGLMILLGSDKSLTILCVAGFDSDKELTTNDMTAIADKMDLNAL